MSLLPTLRRFLISPRQAVAWIAGQPKVLWGRFRSKWKEPLAVKTITSVRTSPELLTTILGLDDDTWYTISFVAEHRYEPKSPEYRTFKRRVAGYVNRNAMGSLPHEVKRIGDRPEGKAWLGSVWKAQFKGDELALAQQLTANPGIVLARNVQEPPWYQLPWYYRKTIAAVSGAMLVLIAVGWALRQGRMPVVGGNPVYRVAMVPSYRDAADSAVAAMVYDYLPKPQFQTVPLHLIEPDREPDYEALAAELEADFVLYGYFLDEAKPLIWRGVLWTAKDRVNIEVRGKSTADAARELVRLLNQSLEQTVLGERTLHFSRQTEANLFYVEGSKSLAEGHYFIAQAFFQRALAHDPDFALAAFKSAICLRNQGKNEAAEALLYKTIERGPGETADQAYLLLLERVVYGEMDHARGLALAQQAIDQTDDTYFHYRFQLNQLHFETMAGCTVEHVPPPPQDSPDLEFEYLYTLGYLAFHRNEYPSAIAYFSDAIDLGLALRLDLKCFRALDQLARCYWQLNDLEMVEELLLDLEMLMPVARKSGSESAKLLVDYWTAMVRSRQKQGPEIEADLKDVAERARELGTKDIEVWSTVQWFDLQYKKSQISRDCETALTDLVSSSAGYKPFHRVTLLTRRYQLHRIRGENTEARRIIEIAAGIARDYQLPPLTQAATLNDLGWVLYLLRELDMAEQKFIEAKNIVPHNHPLSNVITWNLDKVSEEKGFPREP